MSLWDAVFDLALQLWLGSVEDHIFFCAALETIAPEFLTATLHFAIQSLSSRYRPVRGGSGVAGVQELQNKEATRFTQERNSELGIRKSEFREAQRPSGALFLESFCNEPAFLILRLLNF